MRFLISEVLILVLVLVWCCTDVLSVGFLDFKEQSRIETIVFSNQRGFTRQQAFDWLYFNDPVLVVYCQLRYRDNDTDVNRNYLVRKFASQGMSPSLTLSSPTGSKTFDFETPIYEENFSYWTMNISKTEVLKDIACNEKAPWNFKAELKKGLNLYETWGSLVFGDTEPLLNVKLGDSIESNSIDLRSAPDGVLLWHSPCSLGVAALVPRLNVTEMSYTGCYMAVSYAGFSPNTTRWYDLLHLSARRPDAYSLCKEAEFSRCSKLAILDFTIVLDYILVVTTKGLMRSQNMEEVLLQTENAKLEFRAVQTGHPVLDKLFEGGVQSTDTINLHYAVQCSSHMGTERNEVYLRYLPKQTTGKLQQGAVLVSEAPFDQWKTLEISEPVAHLPVLAVVADFQRQTTIMLFHEADQARSLVAVQESRRTHAGNFHPAYRFPPNVTLNGMTLQPYTNALFAYGSQVWQSLDGGNSFHKIIAVQPAYDLISSVFVEDHGVGFTCFTNFGQSFLGKAGMPRALPLELGRSVTDSSLKTYIMKQESEVNLLTLPDASNLVSLKSEHIDLKQHIAMKSGGSLQHGPLLVRFRTADRVDLFTFCQNAFFSNDVIPCNDSFQSSDMGRVLHTRGGAVIMLDAVVPESASSDFSGRVAGHVLGSLPFDDHEYTSALRYAVELIWSENDLTLTLLNVTSDSGWKGEDVGKTAYFSDDIAIIVSAYVNASVARGRSPSQRTQSKNTVRVYQAGLWGLIDFRPFEARQPKEGQVLRVGQVGVGHSPVTIQGGPFFTDSDVGKILKADRGWGYITSVTSDSSATVNITHAMSGNHTGNWGLYEANATQESGTPEVQRRFWLEEDECKHFLVKASGSDRRSYHLDSNENLSLTVRAISKVMPGIGNAKPLLRMSFGNSSLFYVESYYRISKLNHSLHVTIKQRPYVPGESSVIFRLDQASFLCKDTAHMVMIYGGCPPSKRLIFSYPLLLTADFLRREVKDKKGVVRNFKLPYNYRPPSSRGTGIPMSENIYNVHPDKPPYRDAYAITRQTARYKQCAGKTNRKSCGCTTETRMSSLLHHSDCIDTVYRVLFTDTLRPRFAVFDEGPLRFPYYLEELNGRKDFVIISPYTMSFKAISSPMMDQALNSSIEFLGSGLYHFRAHVVQKNYTFCKLTDEFLVYVDETPLPSPVHDIVRACTGMAFTAMLYVVYFWTFHGKKKMKNG